MGALGNFARRFSSLQSRRAAASTSVMSSVPLEFLKFNAKAIGRQAYPPVIVLHGLMASSGTYRSLLKRHEFGEPSRELHYMERDKSGSLTLFLFSIQPRRETFTRWIYETMVPVPITTRQTMNPWHSTSDHSWMRQVWAPIVPKLNLKK